MDGSDAQAAGQDVLNPPSLQHCPSLQPCLTTLPHSLPSPRLAVVAAQ